MNCYEATTIMKFLRHSHQNKMNELLKLQFDQNFLKGNEGTSNYWKEFIAKCKNNKTFEESDGMKRKNP